MDEVSDSKGLDDAVAPEPAAARVRYLPSSMGASFLVSPAVKRLKVIVRWGDYHARKARANEPGPFVWERTGHEEVVIIELPEQTEQPTEQPVPRSDGLRVALSVRPALTGNIEGGLPPGTRSVSVFLVNRRTPQPEGIRDQAFAFQTQLEIHSEHPFVPRPDLRSLQSEDWDERVADLQYRDAFEFAVGHSVATEALIDGGHCRTVRTCWIPQAEVERVAPKPIAGVELSMDALAQLADGGQAREKLTAFVAQYRAWIDEQRRKAPTSPASRVTTAEELLQRATVASGRIEQGINLLADATVLEAFRIANRAMATASTAISHATDRTTSVSLHTISPFIAAWK